MKLIQQKIILLLLATFVGLLISCNTNKKTVTDLPERVKTPDVSTGEGKYIVSAPVVRKEFVNKGGKAMGYDELYLRRSMQDYFIKFCESKVSRSELEKHLPIDSHFQSVTLEVEFREGNWDICEGDPEEMQSRIGKYVIIHKIILSDSNE